MTDGMSSPLATCIKKLSGPIKRFAFDKMAADSRIVCLPAKRITFLNTGSFSSPNCMIEKSCEIKWMSRAQLSEANF